MIGLSVQDLDCKLTGNAHELTLRFQSLHTHVLDLAKANIYCHEMRKHG